MTTRLSQRKVKGGDPAYPSLQAELEARHLGSGGGGYTVPAGGIPRADMTADVREALGFAEISYTLPVDGIPMADLDATVSSALSKAQTAYQKPAGGIGAADLEPSIQEKLTDFSSYYVYPAGGIPAVDLDTHVRAALTHGAAAYQKPETGIPAADLAEDVTAKLTLAEQAYQKPATGIPLSDIGAPVLTTSDLTLINNHMSDPSLHVTSHSDLTETGTYTHTIIDDMLDSHKMLLTDIGKEIDDARDTFGSLANRIDSTLGRNSFYSIDTKEEWNEGQMTDLHVNDEGRVCFTFSPEAVTMDLFDIAYGETLTADRKIGALMFADKTHINLGTNPWIAITNRYDFVGLQMKAYVYAPHTGLYDFSVQFSGRKRLQVAGQLLVDGTQAYSSVDAYTSSGTVLLEGGRLYPIVAEGWYTNAGPRIISLMWKPPGQTTSSFIPSVYMNMSGYTVDEGIYETARIDLRDDSISTWHLEIDADEYRVDDDILPEVATSLDGLTFTGWTPFSPLAAIPVEPARYAKFRLTVRKDYKEYTPLLNSLRVRYISSANNEMRAELMAARDSFLSLKHRFEHIDSSVQNLTKLYEQVNVSGIHPEQFASLRLIQTELNQLRYFLLHAQAEGGAISLFDGAANPFAADEGIDASRSDAYQVSGGSLTQKQFYQRMSQDADWAKWSLDRLDYGGNQLRLGLTGTGDGIAKSITFDNTYWWSTRDSARLSDQYQNLIAQAFYTDTLTSVITALQVQTYDASNHPTSMLQLLESNAAGTAPDLSKVVWSVSMGTSTGNRVYTNLRIAVKPLTKYWLVIRLDTVRYAGGYSRWYLSYNNANTNARLRGTNPENKHLNVMYSSNYGGTWVTDTGYFLSFSIEEATMFEPEGYGSYIADYSKETLFISAEHNVTNTSDGIFGLTYQSSADQAIWSPPVSTITSVPPGRFLKINVMMKKASTGYGSPLLNWLDIYHLDRDMEVVSEPIKTRFVPTHFIFTAGTSDPEGVTFQVSRDDGHTWTDCIMNDYTRLDGIRPGTDVRVKAVFSGFKPLTEVYEWAYLAVRYRDVTGQNITALYEESLAEEGQTIVTTEGRFPMGNNALQVFLNGIRQSVFKDYNELDEHTIEFTEPLVGGIDPDRLTLVVSTGAYDLHDSSITARVEDLEAVFSEELQSHRKRHAYDESGRLIRTTYLDGPRFHEESFEYDAQGRKSASIVVIGEMQKRTDYLYDDQNRIEEEVVTISEVTI